MSTYAYTTGLMKRISAFLVVLLFAVSAFAGWVVVYQDADTIVMKREGQRVFPTNNILPWLLPLTNYTVPGTNIIFYPNTGTVSSNFLHVPGSPATVINQ